MEKNTFLVIGGDERSVYCAEKLCSKGLAVSVFGFNKSVNFSENIIMPDDLESGLKNAESIILPLPCTKNTMINAPLYETEIPVMLALDMMTTNQNLYGGKFEPWLITALNERRINYFDYTQQEEFSVLNAIATAEGAIQVAINESPETINGSTCLVLGFGRIAKLLCHILKGLGAHVTVSARKTHDLAWIRAYGYTPIHTEDISKKSKESQIIFNTIPSLVMSREVLSGLHKNCLVIDLASSPGGVDFISAKRLGIKTIHALSLPGKVAPKTAGEIICDTILNIANTLEVTS